MTILDLKGKICENSRQIHLKTILYSRCIDFSWQFGTY